MAEAARYCRACGKKLEKGATFCPYCGERVEAPGDAPAREARGSEAEISTVAQDAQAAVPKQAPSSTTVSHAPTTRTRVFNPVTTPARAREIGTRFAMVVSWNEWTTGEQPSVEVSKDIEPSVEHGDKYLKILKEEIRRFKSE